MKISGKTDRHSEKVLESDDEAGKTAFHSGLKQSIETHSFGELDGWSTLFNSSAFRFNTL